MVDKICDFLMQKIKKDDPEMDKEQEEIIYYGIQLIVGEIPKTFIMIFLAFLLGVGKLAIISFLMILPYRACSGGFHLKTHIGCIIGTTVMYCGVVFLAQYLPLEGYIKYIAIGIVWIFGMLMIKKYAPADTENVPILAKKERKKKKNLSYLILTASLILAIFIKDTIISNILIYGMFIQTISITRIAYKVTKNQYGHEVYKEQINIA